MFVDSQLSLRLIEALRGTMAEVEQTSGLIPDDPSFVALQRILLVKIADLEAQRALNAATPEASVSEAPSTPDQPE